MCSEITRLNQLLYTPCDDGKGGQDLELSTMHVVLLSDWNGKDLSRCRRPEG